MLRKHGVKIGHAAWPGGGLSISDNIKRFPLDVGLCCSLQILRKISFVQFLLRDCCSVPLVDVGASRKDADIVVSIFFAVVGIQNSVAVDKRRSFLSSDEDTD